MSASSAWARNGHRQAGVRCGRPGARRVHLRALWARASCGSRGRGRYDRPLRASGCSWDITYLYSPIKGIYFYLYMIMDVFSRKIVGWAVHDTECQELASDLIKAACADEGVDQDQIDLHSDNGGPMKGGIMLATLRELGIMPSFNRPRVSNDNPFSEYLFRIVRYCPQYPSKPFATVEAASSWVSRFVNWYNHHHLHSSIRYVTAAQRHAGEDRVILEKRPVVHQAAKSNNPARWSGKTRDWSRVETVRLNPARNQPTNGAA